MSRTIYIMAAFIAVGVWLPWPTGGNADFSGADIRFAGPGDPAARHDNLASRPLLDPTRGAKARGSTGAVAEPAMDFDSRYVLKGLALHETVDIAVVEDKVSRKFIRLQRGQVLGEWFLADVVGTEARFSNASGQLRALKMAAVTASGQSAPDPNAPLAPKM